jgi:hypothetical protein
MKRIWFVVISILVLRAKALKLISSDEFVKLQKQINYRKWIKMNYMMILRKLCDQWH